MYRKVEKLVDGEWQESKFENLKVNDIFRIFDSEHRLIEGPCHRVIAPPNLSIDKPFVISERISVSQIFMKGR